MPYGSSSGSGGSGGALTAGPSQTLSGSGTIAVTSIPGTGQDLIVSLYYARSTVATVSDQLVMRLNNDSGSNYAWEQRASNAATTTTSNSAGAVAFINLGFAPGSTQVSVVYACVEVTIFGYSTASNYKAVQWRNAWVSGTTGPNALAAGSQNIYDGMGLWGNNVNAVTEVDFFINDAPNTLASGAVCKTYLRT
jgi:hypothetical protein